MNYGILRETLICLKFRGIPKKHSDLIEVQWCPFRNLEVKDGNGKHVKFPKRECIMGSCEQCSCEQYCNELVKNNLELLKKRSQIEWQQWVNVETKTKAGKISRKLKQVLKGGTLKKVFDAYMEKLKFMSFHQFSKIWQMKQFNLCKRNLQKGQVILVHYFSQNILLYTQDEPQGAHWDHNQITVHPTVCFYL